MLKFRNKILSALLTAAMLVTLSSVSAWCETPVDDAEQAADAGDAGDAGDGEETDKNDKDKDKDNDKNKTLTDEEGLAEMRKVAQSSGYELYFNDKTTAFALKSKKGGHVWWSAPLNLNSDPTAKPTQKKVMQSPFYVKYGDVATHTPQKINAYEGSIKSKAYEVSDIDNGVRIDFTFNKIDDAVIPMTVVLEDDHVSVSILCTQIKEKVATETSGRAILDIGLLQYFDAATTEENGYMIVPDGSGAIINYNNQRVNAQVYSNKVYGLDASVGLLQRPSKTAQVYLPVVASITKNDSGADNGFMAVCRKGDTFASVNATVSGQNQNATSYNNTWFEFKVRTEDTYYMGTRKLTVYEAGEIHQPDINVCYYPLEGDDLSYVDVAKRYRKYLIDERGLTDKNNEITSSFYLSLYGGTIKTQSIAGLPMNMETPATTYEQAQLIMEDLAALGVDDIILNYKDYNNAGVKGLVSAGIDYSGVLGGKGAYEKLGQYIDSIGAKLFPSLGVTEMKTSGNGYSYSLNACKQVTKAYATQNNWDIAFGIPNQVRLVTTTNLAPFYWEDLFNKIINSFNSEGIKFISLSDASTNLYSDFSRGVYTRDRTVQELTAGYKRLRDAGYTILADGANEYALPYIDYLCDVPLTSSNFDVFDYDIPFYSMVIHGLVPYTTTAINASANASDSVMLALATATPVHYDMMYTDPNDFTDCDYDELFYSNYRGWLEPSAKIYKLYKDYLSDYTALDIEKYEFVTADVIKTTFSNGKTITVNTRDISLNVDGKDIDLAQYGLKGEANE